MRRIGHGTLLLIALLVFMLICMLISGIVYSSRKLGESCYYRIAYYPANPNDHKPVYMDTCVTYAPQHLAVKAD